MTLRPTAPSRLLAATLAPALALMFAAAPQAGAQQEPLVTVATDVVGDGFGGSLANVGDVDGDAIDDYAVGAPKADLDGDRRGQVLVFSGADHSLIWTFDGTADLHEFGRSVAGAGDVDDDGHADILVGEPWPYVGATTAGSAYVFSGADGSLLHTFTGDQVGDEFGAAVAGIGDLDDDGHADVAVGAPDRLDGGLLGGRVAVFSGDTGLLLYDVPLPEPGIILGTSLAGMGDVSGDGVPDIAAGAEGWTHTGLPRMGSVLLLSGVDGALLAVGAPPAAWGPANNDIGDNGGALGDVDADGTRDFWGAGKEVLMVWSGADGSLLLEIPAWTEASDRPHAADLGDVDGDGHDDILVGDPEVDTFVDRGGQARVHSGATGELLMVHRGMGHYAKRASAVAVLGDADGDGAPEFLLGEPHHTGGHIGHVYLLEYAPLRDALQVSGPAPTQGGWSATARAAGDVDNDGAVDVITGEPYDDTAGNDAGRALVWSGRDGALLMEVYGDANPDRAGWAVAAAGDVDGDGFDDVAVALPYRQTPLAGAVRVYSGKTQALLHQIDGSNYADRFGTSIANVGDLDGDGADELLIGAPYDDAGALDAGTAFLHSGADGSLVHAFHGASTGLAYGHAVGGGGDVDGDGTPDLLISVPNALQPGNLTPGTLEVRSGATYGLLYTLAGNSNGDQFGVTAGSYDVIGDVTGDGQDDIVVGVPAEARITAWSGADGAFLWEFKPDYNSHLGHAVAGVGDLDGDDVPDVFVGVTNKFVVEQNDGEAWLVSGVDGTPLEGYVSVPSSELGGAVDGLGDLDLDSRAELMAVSGAGSTPLPTFHTWINGQGASPFQNRGGVLPGSNGDPTLVPAGTLLPGDPLTVTLANAAPSTATWLVIGFSEVNLPLEGGTLVPGLDVVLAGLPTDGDGTLVMAGPWPAGVPADFTFYLQSWIPDAAGPHGFAASHGVRVVVP